MPDKPRHCAASAKTAATCRAWRLPADLAVSAEPYESLPRLAAASDLALIATPMAGLRGMLSHLRDHRGPVAWLCKGFEAPADVPEGLLGHEVKAQVAPGLAAGVLSGPSFAQEVARGQPTALVAASGESQVREALVAAFHARQPACLCQ